MAQAPVDYPVQLALAYLLLVGYLLRTAFICARLPGAVGVIASGFLFSYFIQEDVFDGRDNLQGLAFFLVLLTAGFEISLGDLKPYILVFALLPATCELLGVAVYAQLAMGYTMVEGFVLATTLFCIGDGLVIPKMSEFGELFPAHPLPRLVFTWAPLEASYALTLFGVLQGLAEPAGQAPVGVGVLVAANLHRIVATVLAGAAMGSAAGWLIPRRRKLAVAGRPVFAGSTVEAYLMILAVALAGFGLGSLVPMVFAPGELFQPELMVIVIGCFFAFVVQHEVLHDLEQVMGGVWVFGQLILFSMLGSKTDLSVAGQFTRVVPLLAVGLPLRFLGVLIATYGTLAMRPCNCKACRRANLASAPRDALFCFLSTLPRATIQGALGAVPLFQRFFHSDPNRRHVEVFIAMAAKLYIVIMAVGGSILLDTAGPLLLRATYSKEGRCEKARASEEQLAQEGWTLQQRRASHDGAHQATELPVAGLPSGSTAGRRTSGSTSTAGRRTSMQQFEARALAAEAPAGPGRRCPCGGRGAGESDSEEYSSQANSSSGSELWNVWGEGGSSREVM